jgi:hypothetical protein
MKFMVIVKADRRTEAGVLPEAKDIEVMGKFNQELMKAGVFVDAAGLQASSKGARVAFDKGAAVVTDGPFAETKELISGYWIWQVGSKQEAIDWARRVPFDKLPGSGRIPELEIRQLFEPGDFQEK